MEKLADSLFVAALRKLMMRERENYPEARPQDYYKLLYQSLLGARHLFARGDEVLRHLEGEADEADPSGPLTTNITLHSPILRVHLGPWVSRRYSLERLAEAFSEGCSRHESLWAKPFSLRVEVLKSLLLAPPFLFPPEEIEPWVETLRENCFPPHHHSFPMVSKFRLRYRGSPSSIFRKRFPDLVGRLG